MADSSLKITAERLGKTLENLSSFVEDELNGAVRNLANAAYASISAQLQQRSGKTKADMAKALRLDTIGPNSYMIHLEGDWANRLEEGYGPYSIRDLLMNSKKIVQVGSRAGEPWVQTSKSGSKFAHVPFEHGLNTVGAKYGDLGTDIKQMFAKNSKGKSQSLRKTFKDLEGNPLSGKVATINDAINDKFQNLVKYQYVHPSGKVTSLFMTYRTVSTAGKDWIHPGSPGLQLFKQAQQFIETELENIVNTILK